MVTRNSSAKREKPRLPCAPEATAQEDRQRARRLHQLPQKESHLIHAVPAHLVYLSLSPSFVFLVALKRFVGVGFLAAISHVIPRLASQVVVSDRPAAARRHLIPERIRSRASLHTDLSNPAQSGGDPVRQQPVLPGAICRPPRPQ